LNLHLVSQLAKTSSIKSSCRRKGFLSSDVEAWRDRCHFRSICTHISVYVPQLLLL